MWLWDWLFNRKAPKTSPERKEPLKRPTSRIRAQSDLTRSWTPQNQNEQREEKVIQDIIDHLDLVREENKTQESEIPTPPRFEVTMDDPDKKYWFLFQDDGHFYAVGPFDTKRDTKLWAAGFSYLVDSAEYVSVIGIVSDLEAFAGVTKVAVKID